MLDHEATDEREVRRAILAKRRVSVGRVPERASRTEKHTIRMMNVFVELVLHVA